MTNTALQNVHMDQFIEEVRMRPAIYDTTMAEYCDRSYKRHLWMEICEKFNPDWSTLEEEQREAIGREMKNRWKSIRDAFVREVRYLKEAAKFGEPPAKKRKYIYYDQLSFLLPTVGSRSNTTVNKIHNLPTLHATHFLHNSSYDDCYSEEALDLKKEPQEPVTNLQEVDLQDTQHPQDSESDRESSVFGGRGGFSNQKSNSIKEEINSKEDKINIWLNWNSKENNDPREPQEERVEVVPIIDNMVETNHQTSHESESNNNSSTNVYEGYGVTADSDYMFLMSLLPSFKKLEDETKSMIKIEIASVLHNAIYGSRRLSEHILLQENGKRSGKTPTKKV
ncbi:uncharacterized protein LOC111054683 [Nilaparvata lugens]|uniref:uncharacterized protein LOC111054683 n=1 Tax=Nilaparvata lugens TaxID=108931 RepID=UPI00193D0EFC|nr:uncharacterized protein LOC111054683 [Nilaparvata lugens]